MIRRSHKTWPGRRGFTLAEMLMAMSIAAIVLVGTTSSIMLAAKALPSSQSPPQQMLDSSRALARIAEELQYATSLGTYDSNCVRFIVQDRNDDGQEEEICYEWSGTAGDPLTRSFNGGEAKTVVASVQSFDLTYWKTAVEQEAGPGQTGSETLLASYYAYYDQGDFTIKDSQYASQYFLPSLPADALSWRVTRVRIPVKSYGMASGATEVQLRVASLGGLPSSVVLADRTMSESSLGWDYSWHDIEFTDAPDMLAGEGLCVVLQHVSGNESCQLRIRNEDAPSSSGVFSKSTNQGLTWSSQNGDAFLYYIYGQVTTIASQPQQQYLVDRISIELRSGTEAVTTASTSVQLPNRPEVSGS